MARNVVGVAALLLAILIVATASLGYGQVALSPGEVIGAVTGSGDPTLAEIVWSIRLPRVVTAIVAGGALGVAGTLMQALFRNPMADAWSLGLVAGGQLGVGLAVAGAAFAGPAVLGALTAFAGLSLTVGAVIGVAVTAAVMAALSRRVGNITLLVVGLMLGFTAQGLVSVILHFANRVGGRVFSGWDDGTFAAATNADLPWLALPVACGIALAVVNAKGLTALLLGETYAASLGTNVPRLRRMTLAATVLLAAPVTALCGPVTFVGLIVPHLARWLARTARILPLIPLAGLAGAMLALTADFIVHLRWEQHFLHLNAVLALVGAPVVIALLVFSPAMRSSS
ncbi:iron ABC transporter permease [uncultured Sphingomonas sp.]|uniref:FecCD family ABC transporter permease n=1 Tax=uncultured Sphingomonas sp. TaxID=158754 RepID=UPI0025FBEB74|nr:iron ABC transporter permease [uncultured Sphingomonas sp.]